MRKGILLATISLIGCFCQTIAQDDALVRNEMARVLSAYKTDGIMRLTIESDLVLSTQPQVNIEKSVGAYFLSKDRVLGNIDDGTTYLQNSKWTVLMLKDQKLMYIDSVMEESSINPKANPIQLLDSSFFVSGATYALTEVNASINLIQVNYPSNYPVLESKLWFDKTTHFLKRAQYATPYEEPAVYSGDTASSATPYTGPPRYYVLTMNFEQTWPQDASDELFEEKQYFSITADNKFIPSAYYKDFRIVLAFRNDEEDD